MQKTFTLLITIVVFCVATQAQDLIILRDGSEIKALVQEVGKTDIKYRRFTNQAGPLYLVEKTLIFKIKYKNGKTDFFGSYQTPTVPTPVVVSPPVAVSTPPPSKPTPPEPQNHVEPQQDLQKRYEAANTQPVVDAPLRNINYHSSTGGLKLGVIGGLNAATFATDAIGISISNLTSFHIGMAGEYELSDNMVLQPSLLYSGQGANLKTTENYYSTSGNTVNITIDGNIGLSYLKVPINLLYHSNGFKIGAGPYIAFLVGKGVKNKYLVTTTSEEITQAKYPNTYALLEKEWGTIEGIKTLDYGINLTAQYELNNGLMFYGNYSLGLSSIDNQATKNRVLSVGIGYFFNK
jgi:Outer membrane protein beta-barrel domain